MTMLGFIRMSLAMLVAASGGFGQIPLPADRGPGSQESLRNEPQQGVISISLHPRETIGDLRTLVHASDLIIDATATVGVPTNFDLSSNIHVETESTLVIHSTIKGGVPGEQNRVILMQRGGKIGDVEVLSPDAPIVSSSRRYLLFLWRVRRDLPESKTGLTRYEVVGSWAGLAVVRDERVWFESDRMSDDLREFNGMNVDSFLELVSSYVQNKEVIKPEDLPEVPWPFTREEWEERKRQMEMERK